MRHLRMMLALAKQLDRTLVMTGIKKHYMDRGRRSKGAVPLVPDMSKKCFKEAAPHFIDFEEILDMWVMMWRGLS